MLSGDNHERMLSLHKQYGEIVRIGPTELAFFGPAGFHDIYMHRPNHPLPRKSRSHYPLPPNGIDNIVTTDNEAIHARHRRLLGNAFSEKSLREQEPLLLKYVDLFIRKIHEQRLAGKPVDMKNMFDCLIFDITGDLMLGESFDCLNNNKLHPWIELLFGSAKAYAYLIAANQFSFTKKALEYLIPSSVIQKGIDHFNLTKDKVEARLKISTDHPDIINMTLRNGLKEDDDFVPTDKEKVMTRSELHSNAYV
jgi:cytochrome P450